MADARRPARAAAGTQAGAQAGAATDVDVMVVGAGPTGLLAACELLRRGVRVRIIDVAPQPSPAPRALSLWPRALDILADLSVGGGIVDSSIRVDAFRYFSDRRQVARFGFPPHLASRILPQPVVERLLTDLLRSLGGKVERGVRLLRLVQEGVAADSAGAVVAVLDHADGGTEQVRVPYLIGADGARSTVRDQIGARFAGSTYETAFGLVDAHVDGDLPANEVRYYQSPAGTVVIVPAPEGVFRFLTVLPLGTPAVTVPMMQAVVDERGPAGLRIADPVWRTVFRVHARQADRFSSGRVFLAGDAAHVHSPAGGQGLNNGIQDAHNLAWKLAAVLHREAPSSLLDGYGPERTEATRRIVRDTDVQTRAWMVQGRLRVTARDTAFRLLDRTGLVSWGYTPVLAGRRLVYPPARETQRPSRSLWSACRLRGALPSGLRVGGAFPRELAGRYGFGGPDADPTLWTVVVAPPTGPDAAAWLDRVDRSVAGYSMVRVVRLGDDAATAATGCRRTGYFMVRPDGHVAAHGHHDDLARLGTELAATFR